MKSSNGNLSKGLVIQSICTLILLILVCVSAFNKKLFFLADLMAGITFFVIAYNKKNSKKYIPVLCIIFGILFIIISIWSFING